jgi:hypothetical protein
VCCSSSSDAIFSLCAQSALLSAGPRHCHPPFCWAVEKEMERKYFIFISRAAVFFAVHFVQKAQGRHLMVSVHGGPTINNNISSSINVNEV